MDALARVAAQEVVFHFVGIRPNAADAVRLLEYGNLVACLEQLVGGGEAGGPGADDRYLQGAFVGCPSSERVALAMSLGRLSATVSMRGSVESPTFQRW